jgi:hypothetical protein
MTTETVAREIRETFVRTLRMRQPDLLAPVLAESVVWSLPGTSRISGEAIGSQAVMERARAIGSVGMQPSFSRFRRSRPVFTQHGFARRKNL